MKNKFGIWFILFSLFIINLQSQVERSGSPLSEQFLLNSINVTIGGSFIVNGTFQASPTERIDNFVTRIFNTAKLPYLSQVRDINSFSRISKEIDEYALRDIKLKRFSGEVISIDLQKFRLTGDFNYNPYLHNDDVLIFPSNDVETRFIEISGAINAE